MPSIKQRSGQFPSTHPRPKFLTLIRFILRDRHVWADRLVLTIDHNPKPEGVRLVSELLGDPLPEAGERFGFEDAEAGQVGWGDVLLVERGHVESLMLREGVVRDDLTNSRDEACSSASTGRQLTFTVIYKCCSSFSLLAASFSSRSLSNRASVTRIVGPVSNPTQPGMYIGNEAY